MAPDFSPQDKPSADKSALSKADFTIGTFPERIDTVRAAVLAALLESRVLTGLDAVVKESTTRLSAVIFALEKEYGWHIERKEIAAGTRDGRVAEIAKYWMLQSSIAAAFDAGGRDWINRVKEARVARRKDADKCKMQAARMNAKRNKDPRQGDLLEVTA
ncbi:MAG: helix-turn-helix domain-containing protein [Rhodocyclaceae bacterium]|nr:helix-turn-helix domain-containing protein [Rhodocyclaceae bacterium]